jgi:Sulfotransferase family
LTVSDGGLFGDPMFVLCHGRSGSTLLRFLLDAHPDLACPPETNLPGLCVQLATVWSLIEGAPLAATRGDEPPEIPEAAIAGVRETMDRMVGSYLARRGKKRYCDKSLGTAPYAELLSRVYPQARFVCVSRHPMDVIASGAEACPWGLSGYGFDPYIGATPGNMVTALASFWADNTRMILAARERLGGRCFALRYEDLVADPEDTAAQLFEFLGVAPAPGISERCFSSERERFGPGDHKIWYTSKVSSESVGRGWSVPADMIGPQMLPHINELAARLGYLAIGDDWGTTEPPTDLRVTAVPPSAEAPPAAPAQAAGPVADERAGPAARSAPDAAGAPPAEESLAEGTRRPVVVAAEGPFRSELLGRQLGAGLTAARPQRWGEHSSETLVAVVITRDAAQLGEYWLTDLAAATVTAVTRDAQEDSDWDVIAAQEVWEKILRREVNLSVAVRSGELRYCDNGEATPRAADSRMAILGELLGLAAWR